MAGTRHQQEGPRKCRIVQDHTLVQGGLGILGYQLTPCGRIGIVPVRHADAAARGLVVGDQQQIVVREEAGKNAGACGVSIHDLDEMRSFRIDELGHVHIVG